MPSQKTQGLSLLHFLTDKNAKPEQEPLLYIESGFTLPGLSVANPNADKLLSEGLQYFQIQPKTGFVYFKPEISAWIIRGKQHAIIAYPWELSRYPTGNKKSIVVFGNMKTHEWATNLDGPLANEAHASFLLSKLDKFYLNDH